VEQTRELVIDGLSKHFGDKAVVENVSLELQRGEIVALLGPSGCGKTTTLRMVAGLAAPDGGEIRHRDRILVSATRGVSLPPERRNVGMVFQSYALWPHMTVRENVSYPLRIRKVARPEIDERVARVLTLIGLGDLGGRLITQLSGGQQQRVALARALIYEPALMLFDEPFSNLDAQLRVQMRLELKALRRKVEMTGFFVTHDQTEALSIADRIAIMRDGRVEQVGTPRDIYKKPATRFVRDFLGRAFALRGRVVRDGGLAIALDEGAGVIAIPGSAPALSGGEEVEVSIRPEYVSVTPLAANAAPGALTGRIVDLLFNGDTFEAHLSVGGQSVTMTLPTGRDWVEGEPVAILLDAGNLQLWHGGAVVPLGAA